MMVLEESSYERDRTRQGGNVEDYAKESLIYVGWS